MSKLFGLFVFIIALLLIIASIAYGVFGGKYADRGQKLGIAAAAIVIGIILIFFSSITTVDARSVGIQTGFGKYYDTLDSGVQMTAPWSSVEEWSTRNQTIRFAGNGGDEERDNYTTEPFHTVRLGSQAEAYVDATITWAIADTSTATNNTTVLTEDVKKSTQSLWRQYKTFEDTRRDFVTPTAQTSMSAIFDSYEPLASINAQNAENPYVSNEEWSRRLTEKLGAAYKARGVTLVSAQVTKVRYDQKTEEKLRGYSDEVANTKIATQKVKTAEEEAKASAARTNPNQVRPGCEALLRDLAAQDQLKNLPSAFNCGAASGTSLNITPR